MQVSQASPKASASAFSCPALATPGQLSTPPQTPSPSTSFVGSVGQASLTTPSPSASGNVIVKIAAAGVTQSAPYANDQPTDTIDAVSAGVTS